MTRSNHEASGEAQAMNRRQFGKKTMVGLSALALTNSGREVRGQDQPPPEKPSDAEHLLKVIQSRWGSRLSPEQLEELRKGLQGKLDASSRLSAFPLTNADEPGPVFSAYRAD